MTRRLAPVLLLLLVGCGEPGGPQPVARYEYPAATQEWPIFRDSRPLPEQSDLMRRARRVTGDPGPRLQLAVYETDASFDDVVAFYTAAFGTGGLSAAESATVSLGEGHFEDDEAAVKPVLEGLGLPLSAGAHTGSYRTAVFRSEGELPIVSVQRPYRDYLTDRVIDRTFIMIEGRPRG